MTANCPAHVHSRKVNTQGESFLTCSFKVAKQSFDPMLQLHKVFQSKIFPKLGIIAGLASTSFLIGGLLPDKAIANPSFFEYRWDDSSKYKKLYYWQSSQEKRDRSTYYLVMREKDRRNAILKLSIKIPENFDANITTRKLSLCRVNLGGMLTRTKCIEKIPAVFEVSKKHHLTSEVVIEAARESMPVLRENPSC